MAEKVTKKKLEQALETYAGLIEVYPDNEDYLQRYADMLQALGRGATATLTLQHLHDVIAKRSEKEALLFAKEHPQIGRISLEEVFDAQDKHIIAGKIIYELLGKIWLKVHQKKLKEGQAVCQANDPSDSLILVLKGNVDIYALDNNKNRVLLENVGVYDILAENTFLTPSKYGFDAFVSSESAIIVKVPRKKILNMLENNEHLHNMLNQRARFRHLVQRIALHPIFKTLPLKLCKYLARYTSTKIFPEKNMLLSLDEHTDGLYMILSGNASYVARNKAGKRFALPPLKKLSLVGNLLLQSNVQRTHELIAINKVSTLSFPLEPLMNINAAFPPLMERLVQHAEQQQQHIAHAIAKL